MKRKVVKHGNATLTLSLPIKWAKKYGIKQGDELEIEERANSLIVQTGKALFSEAKTIDITGLSEMVIWRVIDAAYRSGAEEIRITFSDEGPKSTKFSEKKNITILDYVRLIVDRLIGMEIISQGKTFCIIREISSIKEEEFENVLRRIFMYIGNMFNDSMDAINKDDRILLKNLSDNIDSPLNKLVRYCLRYINKGYLEPREASALYYIISQLEEIGDSIVFILRTISEMKKPLRKGIIGLFHETSGLFGMMHKTFYKFGIKEFSEVYSERAEIKEKIASLKNLPEQEIKIAGALKMVSNYAIEIINTKMIESI